MNSNSSDPVAIHVRDVNHFYGDGAARKQALHANNLTVHAGEIIIMTGPSGSGKTTLLTLIGALRAVQEGSIELFGTELKGLSAKEQVELRKNIGFIFQAHNLLEGLTARQNLRMAIELTDRPRSEYDQIADQMLSDLGLAERINYKPRNLSGGQRQRVAIGRALVNQPKLILADEPTAALDKESGAKVVEMLRTLANQHRAAVMIVTHDNRILNVADRIVNMIDGHIVSDMNVKRTLEITKVIQECDVFQKMSPSDLTNVAAKMEDASFAAGEHIITEGEMGDKFYVIARGKVNVIVNENRPDLSTAVAELGDHAFFGEVALMKDQPRNASVVATQETVCYTLQKKDFLEAVAANKSFEDQIGGALFNRG